LLLNPFSVAKPPSLADISKATGYARSTVSMALRNDKSIPKETRKKIERAAQACGYYPNPILAALGRKHFDAEDIGGISIARIEMYTEPPTEGPERARLEAQREYARKLGYRLESFPLANFRDGHHATRVLYARGIQGIILPAHFELDMLPGMSWSRFCVVGWGEGTTESSASSETLLYRAMVDHFSLVTRAWEETWKRGYRRIGFALFQIVPNIIEDQIRLGAIQCCLLRVPARDRILPFIPKKEIGDWDAHLLTDWVRRHRPDVVIGFNPYFRWALESEGFRIPRDIGFAALHKDLDLDQLPGGGERDSGMREMRTKVMMAAVELMDQQIRSHQYGLPKEQRVLLINSEWVDGETLPSKISSKGN
jgi:LacI family transcriptional regulator